MFQKVKDPVIKLHLVKTPGKEKKHIILISSSDRFPVEPRREIKHILKQTEVKGLGWEFPGGSSGSGANKI